MFEQSVLDWWKEQRTHTLDQAKRDELVENLVPDASVGQYFKAPDMPKPIRASMKKIKVDA